MFAQRGEVMDVQKQDDLIKEAFEIEAEEIGFCLDQLWGDYENPYENSDTALAFNLFKKGWLAKAQAVPEGFVLVKKELPEQIAEKMAIDRIDKPRHENDPVWREIAEQSYKDQVKSKKWEFWRDYKAMIEAQEQSHE